MVEVHTDRDGLKNWSVRFFLWQKPPAAVIICTVVHLRADPMIQGRVKFFSTVRWREAVICDKGNWGWFAFQNSFHQISMGFKLDFDLPDREVNL